LAGRLRVIGRQPKGRPHNHVEPRQDDDADTLDGLGRSGAPMMRAISRRIRTLEDRLAPGEPPKFLFSFSVLYEGFLDIERCRRTLGECGFLPRSPGMHIVNLWGLPESLSGDEIDAWLREHGASTCNRNGL
jgi:hypothetical protein